MKTLLAIGAAAVFIAAVWVPGVSARRDINVGDPAPPFTLQGSDGKTYRLAAYKGKQAVVLAWFAKAFTGG